MALLTAITVPTYQVLIDRTRTEEARSTLQAIAHAELRHFRDQHAYLACPAQGDVPKGPVAFANDADCWKRLGIQVDGVVRYRYSVTAAEGTFDAVAEGDLDGDGVTSRFTLHGRDLSLDVVNERE